MRLWLHYFPSRLLHNVMILSCDEVVRLAAALSFLFCHWYCSGVSKLRQQPEINVRLSKYVCKICLHRAILKDGPFQYP